MLPTLLVAACGLASLALAAPPNIILFITDDQDVEMGSLAHMPKVQKLLAAEGAVLSRMYAHVSVCCPSRSSLISGRYMHNNGCRANTLETNCSSTYFQSHMEPGSFAVALHSGGYRTHYSGKYLNLYGDPAVGGVAHVPAGWDNWQALVGNSVYYNYQLSNNGTMERHAADYATDYLPNVVLNKTLDFLAANLGGGAPVLAVLSTPSCHGPQTAAPQYQDAFPGAQAPRGPTYNATVAGTSWLQSTHGGYSFQQPHADFADLVFRRRLQTLLTVDDMVEQVVLALQSKGQLENTYIVYTADNGYHTGAYGLVYDKRNPFETDTHLPLLIRGPGIAPGTASATPVSMPDISATLLDMAGLPVPAYFDGSSVLGLVQQAGWRQQQQRQGAADAAAAPPAPRLATLLEYTGEGGGGGDKTLCPATAGDNTVYCNGANNYSQPPYWFGSDFCMCQDSLNNTYSCLRVVQGASAAPEAAAMLSAQGSPAAAAVAGGAAAAALDYRYCEFKDRVGTVEFFNLTADPHELVNTAGSLSKAARQTLSARLAAVRACKGYAECGPLLAEPIVL